ncbi:MAG: AAA family ATPase [Acidobacteria bacterium]|nr:AAA family ATPase [Acidobacteriota bacterium]
MSVAAELYLSTSPYPGLRSFRRDEDDIFFGREEQTDQLLERLGRCRFLVVVGPSGCGKSSLVRAGLMAALETGFLAAAGVRWRLTEMRPGEQPLARLANALLAPSALGPERAEEPDAAAFLLATLRRGPMGLVEAMRETPPANNANLLLLVDQFEEIFRFRAQGNADEADAFVAMLLATAMQREFPVYVVITMRSDFLGECALFNGLPEAINEGQYLTPRLTREQFRAAIISPSRVFGGDVALTLVNRLLNDMSPDPDQLPLLQHSLMRMWASASERAKGDGRRSNQSVPTPDEPRTNAPTITLDDYYAVGTLTHDLSIHADEVFAQLTEEQQRMAEVMFRRLTERAIGRRDTRRPTRLQEVADVAEAEIDQVNAIVEVFRQPDHSFITPPPPTPLLHETILDIGHESLIRQWRRLNEWVKEEAQSAEIYQLLKQTALLWNEGKSDLWGAISLERALTWKSRQNPTPAWAERYGSVEDFELAMEFLRASERQWQETLRREEAKKRALAEAEQQRALAEADRQRAEAERHRVLAEAAHQQAKTERRRAKLQRVFIGILFLASGLMAILSWYALRSRAEAVRQRASFNAMRLAAQAINQMSEGHLDLALLLGAQAYHQSDIFEARNALLSILIDDSRPISFLHGHKEGINSVAVSPDGKTLATGGNDKTIWLWDLVTHKPLGDPLRGGDLGRVHSVAFSPNGKLLVSGGSDNKVLLWDVEKRERIGQLEAHERYVMSVAFSPDGKTVASGSKDKHICLWDVAGRKLLAKLTGHGDTVTSVAFSPDGKTLASGSRDKTIRLWDVATASSRGTLKTQKSFVEVVIFSPDGKTIAANGDDNTISLLDVTTRQPLGLPLSGHIKPVKTLSFSPDSKLLASGGLDNTARLWNIATRQLEKQILKGHTDYVNSVSFTPDSKTLVTGSNDALIRLWDVNSCRPLCERLSEQDTIIWSVAFSPDSSLLASGNHDGTVSLWDVATRRQLGSPLQGHSGRVHSVAFSPDGKLLASGSSDKTVRLWDVSTGQSLNPPLEGHTDGVEVVAFSPDGKLLASGGSDNAIRLWDVDTRRPIDPSLTGHNGYVKSIAFIPDGHLLASSGGDGTIRLWDVKTYSQFGEVINAGNPVSSIASSTDGRMLAFAVQKSIKLTDVRDFSPSRSVTELPEKHSDPVSSIAFNHDGKLLASGSNDRTIILWDVDKRQQLGLPLKGHGSYVFTIAISPDGKLMASGSQDKTILLWNVDADIWRERAESIANRRLSDEEKNKYLK